MWDDLKDAAQQGVMLGIRLGVALLIIALINLAWMGDYWTIRQQAKQGASAFTYLQQQAQAAKQPPQK